MSDLRNGANTESLGSIAYREATLADVPAIMASRAADPDWGPADPRTASYMQGTHHPQRALPPRVTFAALEGDTVVGYIAGHLTERYDCDGEVQSLWVAVDRRRSGLATKLLRMLSRWFVEQGAARVCVDVLPDNVAGRAFYRRHGAEDLNTHWLVWNDMAAALTDRQ